MHNDPDLFAATAAGQPGRPSAVALPRIAQVSGDAHVPRGGTEEMLHIDPEPGTRRAAAVGGQAAQGNGLGGVVGDGVGVLAGGTGGLAQAVERPRLAIPVTDLAENGEASVMMRRCLVSQAQADAGVAEAGERPGFANPIACLLERARA